MNYLVAVLPDRIQAEAAYTALEKEGLPTNQIDILGQGYKSADEFGLINPEQQAKKGFKRLSLWLIPFGYVAGYAFNVLTGMQRHKLDNETNKKGGLNLSTFFLIHAACCNN
ncbi:hypothetical protein RIVM261_073130 [Rivularia sp. IAM M-261]|nr:hypothetical protein RIVM261_073130 [Rivularia sp. IAM M-261]